MTTVGHGPRIARGWIPVLAWVHRTDADSGRRAGWRAMVNWDTSQCLGASGYSRWRVGAVVKAFWNITMLAVHAHIRNARPRYLNVWLWWY